MAEQKLRYGIIGCGSMGREHIENPGQHFGASYIEQQKFADAVRRGLPAEIGLEEGLRAVATGRPRTRASTKAAWSP